MKKFLSLTCFLFSFLGLFAQTWIKEDAPNVQNILKFYSDEKGGLYAKSGNRMFRKPNSTGWSEMKVAGAQMSVGAFSVDKDTLYFLKPSGFAGDYAINRSVDQGLTWTEIGNAKLFETYYTTPSFFYREGVCLTSDSKNIYRSTDMGNTWTSVFAPDGMYLTILDYVYFDGKFICNSVANGTFISSDNGVTWTQENTGLPNPYTYSLVSNGSQAIVSTYNGIAFLNPGTLTWIKKSTGLPNTTPDIYLGAYGDTVFAVSDQIYASYDLGENWTEIFPKYRPNSVKMKGVMLNDTSFFIGGGTGVHVSDRTDYYFHSLNKGFISPNSVLHNVAKYNDSIFLASASGLFKREESELMNWEYTGTDVKPARGIYNFNGYLFAVDGGIKRSTDGGVTWTATSFGHITVDRLVFNGETIFAGTNNGVFRSDDMGETWPEANGGVAHSNKVLYVKGNNLYAADNYGSNPGIWYSTDKGQTYTSIRGNIAETEYNAITEIGGYTYIVVSPEKLYKAPAGTSNWTVVDASEYPTNIFSSHGLIFLSDANGVYLSKDQGDSWEVIHDGLTWQEYKMNFSMIANDTLYATGSTVSKIYKFPVADIVTGMHRSKKETEMSAFPNPVENYLTIPSGHSGRKISIIDNAGNTVKVFTIGSEEFQLDLSGLAPGFYVYEVSSQNSSARGKIIKK